MSQVEGASKAHDAMTPRERLALLGLAFSAFIFGTSESIPIGLLTDIGASFSLDVSQAGVMITIYAWAVTLLSLPLMLLTSKLEMKRLLLGLVAIFCLGQTIAVIAPSFVVLVAARLCVACAHSVFWAIVTPVAVRVVPDRFKPLAISVVATGASLSMIVGLPLGRSIGLALGWRMAFLGLVVVAAVLFACLVAVLPKLPVTDPFTLAKLPGLLHNRMLMGIYLQVALIVTGTYVGYSYIEPFLLEVAGFPAGEVTGVLTLFGVFGIVGSFLFARLYDGHRGPFIKVSIVAMVASLALMLPAASSSASMIALCAMWGLAGTTYNVALQAEELACVPQDASAVAMAIYSGTFNLGIGVGSALGGVVVRGLGLVHVGAVGAAIIVLAVAYCVVRYAPMAWGERR